MLRDMRSRRRDFSIRAYCGTNGGGKTLAAVHDLIPSLEAGRPVLSTVRILDFKDPRPCDDDSCPSPDHGLEGHMAAHPLWIPWTVWEQILDVTGTDILADEISSIASSRQSMNLPQAVETALQQLRKPDNTFSWTGPEFARADAVLRGVTKAVTVCRGFASAQVPGRAWKSKRLFFWQTYDASFLQEFSAEEDKRKRHRQECRQFFWGPGSEAFAAYSTWDSVGIVADVSGSGRCKKCGGRREVPKCRCEVPVPGPRAEGRLRPEHAAPVGPRRVLGDDAVTSEVRSGRSSRIDGLLSSQRV